MENTDKPSTKIFAQFPGENIKSMDFDKANSVLVVITDKGCYLVDSDGVATRI